MPFLKELKPTEDIRILIWKIDENLSDLKASTFLTKEQEKELSKRMLISHKKQYLASRKLIDMVGTNHLDDLFYESMTLKKNVCYSISHTMEFAVVAVGFQNIGVDIESYRPKILNIKTKFINKEENYFMKSNDIKIITRLWTCKEAIYKFFSKNKLSIKEDIILKKFDMQSKYGQGQVYLNDKIIPINLHFSNFGKHQLTLSYL